MKMIEINCPECGSLDCRGGHRSYKCNECNCEFEVKTQYTILAEGNGIYTRYDVDRKVTQ